MFLAAASLTVGQFLFFLLIIVAVIVVLRHF